MDTSKEYIKMCETAEEIQGEWHPDNKIKPTLGDYVCYKEDKDTTVICGCNKFGIEWKEECVWLPRQDQLQEIYKEFTKEDEWTDWGILDIFHEWALNNRFKQWSMEQLWLAFVMWERFGKIWSETDWRKR